MSVTLNATVKGPLFSKKIDQVVQDAIWAETLDKIEDRILRPSKKAQKRIGFRRNKLSPRKNRLVLEVASTLAKPLPSKRKGPRGRKGSGTPRPGWQEKWPAYNPRRKGTSWQATNEKAARAMLPRVLRKTTERIVGELG